MANVNQIMPFATGAQARVLSPQAYAALAARVNGFVAGPADETQLNTVWRQSSFVAAMIAQFVVDQAQVDVLDNGDIATFENNFANAIAKVAYGQVPLLPPSSYWHFGVDNSGAPQSLISDVTPSITTYAAGNIYALRTANTAAGATTANLDGVGVRNVVRADGSPIQAGDWQTGEMIFLADDGSNLRLYGQKSSLAPARKLTATAVAGSYAFTVPAGVYWVYATCIGAGGGASGSSNSSGQTYSSGGGGAGGTAAGWIPVTPGQIIPYVVGAGGQGSAYGILSTGGATSSIGAYMSATGGGGTGNNTATAGGGGGSGMGGQVNIIGGMGGEGNPFLANQASGMGGASSLGGGGRPSTGNVPAIVNGRAPGSGGGACYGPIVANGGNGADGYVSFQY